MKTNRRQNEFALLFSLIVLALVSVAFVLGETGMSRKKRCTKCKVEKSFNEFNKRGDPGGLHYWCRDCFREYYQEHKEEIAEQKQKYNQEHKKERQEYNRKYYQEHKEEYNERQRKRRKNDPMFRLNRNISTAISRNLKIRGNSKNGHHWETLVDFTLQELRDHLESLFLPGMTWDNYGYGDNKWNVDHAISKSHFSFTSTEDESFKECWALSNLQPLWQIDNFKKGTK